MCFSACNKTISFYPVAFQLFERLLGFVSYCCGQQALMVSASDDDLWCNWIPKSNREITVSPGYATCFLKKCSALLQNFMTFEELFSLLPIKRSYVTLSNIKEMKIPALPLRCRPTTEQTLSTLHKIHEPLPVILLTDLSASWLTGHHLWGLKQLFFWISKLRSSA